MGDRSKASLRIDWFDGTLIEDKSSNVYTTSEFADEDRPEPETIVKPEPKEKKPIGFKRLLDISLLDPPGLILEVAHRPGFWNLLDEEELKGDFVVLIVKILSNVYGSLEPGEKSKIVTMLRTRFENSNFLVKLKKYLSELPSVRISEKRLNTQLWDDVDTFFIQISKLCEGIVNFGGNGIEFMTYLYELLEVAEISCLGVCDEHTETVREDFFVKIAELRSRLSSEMGNYPSSSNVPENKNQKLNNFQHINIFPKKDDLLGTNQIQIKPILVNGAYPSVAYYFETQFLLLREDCFGPLREGICKYMENPSKRKYENIRINPKVRVIRTYAANNKVGHLVDIAWAKRLAQTSVDNKRLAYNKQLMYGSLLLFTSDNFETILSATVLDSNLNLLSDGYIAVSFVNPVSRNIFNECYLMVESEVFFEPYHRVLKVLQNSNLNLPMKRYIVDVEKETQHPAYLDSETIYTITKRGSKDDIPFPVLDTEQWPTEAFGLDESQMEAYKFALTREFAVIQGPPGTGKTYLGVKIASTLLKNLSLKCTPMLIICYTNHALDQFLEGLLSTTTDIIRLGSQSKSKLLEPYTLYNARSRTKSKYSHLYAAKRAELEKIFTEMSILQSEIEKCEKEIISYKNIRPYLKIGDKNYELKSCREDSVLNWLFGHLGNENDEYVEEDEWEKLDDLNVVNDLETCFSEQLALKEIDSMLNSIKYVNDVTDDDMGRIKMVEKFEIEISKIRKRLNCFKKYKTLFQNNKKDGSDINNIEDLYSLDLEDRWKLYYTVVESLKNKLLEQINTLVEQYNTVSQDLEHVTTLTDIVVMESARVVGVTTTTAARRHDLLRRMRQPIVIVEEAAEVLEAHIIASLTEYCQHLIMIGDHKQLRPTAAHYKLAKEYNLEISLFERMIRNGVHARTLTTQRRMRPEFIQLLVPVVYPKLDSHPSVYKYPNVRGLADNLYFYTHEVFEDSEGLEDSWSHKNTFEARWCVALANYLRQMNYSPEEITILSTYNGQVTFIKELSRKFNLLRDVIITAVDNYQGEENRIVILSLVRSNRDGNIGFMNATNRICVALSRAKEGFYIFGNMNVLTAASYTWRLINEKLLGQRAIGKKIVLRCRNHTDNILDIENVENFEDCLSGSCLKICGRKQ